MKKTLSADQNSGAIDLAINPQNQKEVYATLWYKERKAWKFVESGASSEFSNPMMVVNLGKNFKLKILAFQQMKTWKNRTFHFPKNPNIIYAIVDNQKTRPVSNAKKKNRKIFGQSQNAKITKEEFLALDDKTVNEYLDGERFPRKIHL